MVFVYVYHISVCLYLYHSFLYAGPLREHWLIFLARKKFRRAEDKLLSVSHGAVEEEDVPFEFGEQTQSPPEYRCFGRPGQGSQWFMGPPSFTNIQVLRELFETLTQPDKKDCS